MVLTKSIILDSFFLSLLLFAFSVQQPISIAISYGLCAVYIIFSFGRFVFNLNHIFIFSIFIIPIFLAVLSFNHGLTSVFYLLSSPLIIVAARIFANKSNQHVLSCLSNVYWLFVFLVFFGLVWHWDDPEPLGAIFPNSSTNGLPSYLIVVQIAFSIAYYFKNNRLPVLSSIVTVVIAGIGLGRGSIIIATSIIVFSLFVNVVVLRLKNDIVFVFMSLTVICLILSMFIYFNDFDLVSYVKIYIEGSKFSGGIFDEHRGRIVADYLNKMDGWSLIFGADYNETSIVEYYGGNPHNSFIRVHSFYGFAGLLYVSIPLFFVLTSGRVMRHKCIISGLITLTLIRAITEPIFFPSTLDFFYILYFFLFFTYTQREKILWQKR